MATSSSLPLHGSPSISRGRQLWEVFCSLALGLIFLRFAVLHGLAVYHTMRLSSILMLAKGTSDALFVMTRRFPKGVSIQMYDWTIGFAGTFCPMLFVPAGNAADNILGQSLQIIGLMLQVAGMFSLNRSIGMVAANRGVQTTGMYRFIRHPLYFSYAVAYAGYVLNQFSEWNACMYVGLICLSILRLSAEERFLLQDPAYQEYAQKVKFRMIPGVF